MVSQGGWEISISTESSVGVIHVIADLSRPLKAIAITNLSIGDRH